MATIESGEALGRFQNELCLFDGKSLYSYNQNLKGWSNRGNLSSVYVTQSSIVRDTRQQTSPDSAVHENGLRCFAWEDSAGGIKCTVLDSVTNVRMAHAISVSSTGTKPRVVSFGQRFLIFYVESQKLYYKYISVSEPSTLSFASQITSTLDATYPNYDACVINDRCFIAWNQSGSFLQAQYLNKNLFSSTVISYGATAGQAVCVFEDSLNNQVVISRYNTAAISFRVYDYDLANVIEYDRIVETIANVSHVTGCAIPGESSKLRFFYTVDSGANYNAFVKKAEANQYIIGSRTVLLRSVGLAGSAFYYLNKTHIVVAHESTFQSTYFLADENGEIEGRFLVNVGGGLPTKSILPKVNAIDETQFQVCLLEKDFLSSSGGNVFTQLGATSLMFNFFDRKNSWLQCEAAQNLHISGGILRMYDGASVVEHGFHLYPENVSGTAETAGATKTYQYCVCYEWTDNQGQIHRSAPSPALTVTTLNDIGGSPNRVTLTIPTLRLTSKRSDVSKVALVVYRTINNGTVFYQTSSITSPTFNDTTVDTVSFVDSTTDTVLQGNPQLYTTGGVIENISPNPLSSMTIFQRRIVGLDSTVPLQLWYTKQIFPGVPAEFSDLQIIAVDSRGGPCTAVGTIDDKLIIFKENSIFYIIGQGPDSTGANDDFTTAQEITTDNGCINPRSVVRVPNGLMYQSKKGIYLLDRSLQVSYIGADVEAYNSETVTSAVLVATTNEVRFTLQSGICLSFDYFYGQWSIFSNIEAVDACIFDGNFTYLQPGGLALQETPGQFSDNGQFIKLKVTTSWLQFAGMQGFQRVYKLLLLGDYKTPHILRVKIAHDFNPNPTQEINIQAGDLLSVPAWGGDSVWGGTETGDSGSWGGSYPLYQWQIYPTQQKSQAIQFTFETLANADNTPGEGASFSGFAVEVGAKSGLNKLPDNRSVS